MDESDSQTISSWIAIIIHFLESHGDSKEKIMQQVGLDPLLLQDVSARYPVSKLTQLWSYAFERHGPTIGLQIAQSFKPRYWSSVGLALQSSKDLDELLRRVSQFAALITTGIELRYINSEIAEKKLTTRLLEPTVLEAERVEAYMGAGYMLCKMMYEQPIAIVQIDLIRPKPADPSPWYDFFGPNLRWNAPEFAIHFSKEALGLVTPHVDSHVSDALEMDLSLRLAQQKTTNFSQTIRKEILLMLPNGKPTLQEVAVRLHLSSRTLQRHLNEEGLNYKSLIESIQLKIAQDYLTLSHYSLFEIALLSGFSNASNFSNAFKRWTDLTPNVYRERHTQPPQQSAYPAR